MKRIKEYIKNNKLYIIIMFLGIISFAIQMKFVVLYADDLRLATIANAGGVKGAFIHLKANYMDWGGGPTPCIAILFLLFSPKVWKIFSCLIMFLMVALSVRMITYNNKFNKGAIAAILWSCIYILNIWISRETLYWLDGHLAYVLTAFQLLLYFYYLYSKIIMKSKIKKYDYVFMPIVAFFSGWTGPQTAVLTVLIGIVFLFWKKFINKEKIEKIYIITIIFSIIGCLVEVLAPGNKARMEVEFPEFATYGIVGKIASRVSSVYNLIFNFYTYNFASICFYLFVVLGVISCIALKLSVSEKNKIIKNIIKLISYIIIGYIIIMLILRLNIFTDFKLLNALIDYRDLLTEYRNGTFRITMLFSYIVSSIIMFWACIVSIYISIKKKNPLLFITVTFAILGQIMMLVAPYSPLRSAFVTIMLLWIAVVYSLLIAHKEDIRVSFIIIMVLAITNVNYGLLAFIIYSIYEKLKNKDGKYNKEIIITTLLLIILSLQNWIAVTKNYRANQNIYYENVSRIKSAVNMNQTNGELNLLSPEKAEYGFNKLVGIEWIEQVVKGYFGLNPNVKFVEEIVKVE